MPTGDTGNPAPHVDAVVRRRSIDARARDLPSSQGLVALLSTALTVLACAPPPGPGEGTDATSDAGPEADALPRGLAFETVPTAGDAVEVELTGLPAGSRTLAGSSFIVRSCVGPDCLEGGSDIAHLAVADADGDFLIDPNLDATAGPDPGAEVNAYYHLESFLRRFQQIGFVGLPRPVHIVLSAWLDFDGDGAPDDFLAGATEVFEGPGILMGTVGDRNLAFDVDVYGHEFTHIVTATSGAQALDTSLDVTGPSVAAGALREGTADFFSASFLGDSAIGEYSAAALGIDSYSDVDNVHKCPGDLLGEAHYDGLVWSGTLWEIRNAIGADRLEPAVFGVVRDLPLGATLPDAFSFVRTALVPSLSSAELGDVDAVLTARGASSCTSIVPAEIGSETPLFLLTPSEEVWDAAHEHVLAFDRMPSALQLAVEIPETLSSLTISVRPDEADVVDVDALVIFVRFGAPVEHTHDGEAHAVVADGQGSVPFVVDAASAPALQPGMLYVSIAYEGDEGGLAFVSLEG